MESPSFWPGCRVSKTEMIVPPRVVSGRIQVLFTAAQI